MTALMEAIIAAGERLVAISGNRIAFDPIRALSRNDDLALGDPGLWSPNRHSRLVACRDDWIAVSLAREDDRDLVPAWTGADFADDVWDAITASAASRTAAEMVETAILLHLPVARVGEAIPLVPKQLQVGGREDGFVLDLSALWAGPYCGALLAETGLEVIKVESPSRPDPTPVHAPRLDARLNVRKRRANIALNSPELRALVADARVLITSGRPHALAKLGLDEKRLFAINPGLLWIAITAHGWRGEAAMRVGFGDDCAAAGGLVGWQDDKPQFLGDALADPLTGVTAATLALSALGEGVAGLVDVSLARTSASFAATLS
ncbi:MAG: CoA transferase [Sphingopyxis sp.]|nr:CoA transferase [Sphingopyxis sp.]